MIKIAILTPNDALNAETFIKHHINHLPFKKVVIYGGNFPYQSDNYSPNKYVKFYFFAVNRLRGFIGLTPKNYKEFCLRQILIKERVDVVFAEYLVTAAETLSVIQSLNIPLVTIALGYDISQYNVIDTYKDRYIKLFEYAQYVIVVSRHMSVNLKSLKCSEDKIIYSAASPNKEFFNLKSDFKNIKLLSVGRFVDKKAPLLLIKAFAIVNDKIPESILVMAGDGPLLEDSLALVEKLRLKDKVIFKGRITPKEHQDLLQDSFMFVQHSRLAKNGDSEGTPVAILEASAAGLPVVSTKHAGIPDIILDGKTGLLSNENDNKQMAKNILNLLSNPEKAKEFGENGRAFVLKNFTLEKHIKTLSEILELSSKSNG